MDPAIPSDLNSTGSAPPSASSEPNFREATARAMHLAAGGIPHAVFVIHIERLKCVTERCGYEAGESLVAEIMQRLVRKCGPWQAYCRLSAERIAILKKDCSCRDAMAFAHRINDALGGEPFRWRGLTFRAGAAVGLLELDRQVEGIDDLLGRAAEACAAARSLGSGGVVVFTGLPGEREALDRERAWREHIQETLS
jgi:GGDEF domain-containing protein